MAYRNARLKALLLVLPLGCQIDVDDAIDDAFGWLDDPLELTIEVPADTSPELVSVGVFETRCGAADARTSDGTDRVVSSCLALLANGQLDPGVSEALDAGEAPVADVWLDPTPVTEGELTVEFPGGVATGSGLLVVWIDQDGDGMLRMGPDGGEPAIVPTRTERNETLLLNEVSIDGSQWRATRSVLDPTDTSWPSGADLGEGELGGWLARF